MASTITSRDLVAEFERHLEEEIQAGHDQEEEFNLYIEYDHYANCACELCDMDTYRAQEREYAQMMMEMGG